MTKQIPYDLIPASDLPRSTPGAFDSVVGVDESTGAARRFPVPVSGAPKAYATRADLPASAAEGTAAYVNNDPNPDNNGLWGYLGGTWAKSADRVSGLEGEVATAAALANSANIKVDALRVDGRLNRNHGARYPLRAYTRAGVISPEDPRWSEFLLDVRVVGARPGELYRIAYMQNGASLDGEATHDWIIEAFPAATYKTTGEGGVILVGYQKATYGEQEQIKRGDGLQTIRLYPVSRPEMRIDITLNSVWLPPIGSPINSIETGRPAWSWIIDPSCYEMRPFLPEDSLTINRGKVMPSRRISRNGITSASSDFLANAILDAKVIGARPGYYYGIRYFKNGADGLPGGQDGWIIEEQDAATYGTTDVATPVVTLSDPAPVIPRTSGIQTLTLHSTNRPGLSFRLVVDPTYFPALGTFVSMNQSARAGWSWIIDPTNYEAERPQVAPASGALSYSTSGGVVRAVWRSGSQLYRVNFGPNGANSLPNVIGIDRAALVEDLNDAVWTTVNSAPTDWLPPLIFHAVNDGDGVNNEFTGGNHLVGGVQTARNVLYRLMADGQPIPAGTSGSCSRLTLLITNEVMASNTVSLGRYALRQTFAVEIVPGSMEVKCECRALEPITVARDYGPQMVTGGFQGTQLILDGQLASRVAFDATLDSGPKSSFPDAWMLILQDGTNGQQASWMDREYGVGSGEHVAADQPLIRGGGANNTKWYQAAIYNAASPLSLAAGQNYKWRGGYAWQAPGLQPAGFDSIVAFWSAGEQHDATVVTGHDYSVLP